MNAKELRIGNLLHAYNDWDYVTVTSLKDGEILHTPNCLGAINDVHVGGIPLTEEWLLKFGFSYTDDKDGLAKEYVIIDLPEPAEIITEKRGFYYVYNLDYMERITPIQYVHQLQNLYFALTGEELTYTPSPSPSR